MQAHGGREHISMIFFFGSVEIIPQFSAILLQRTNVLLFVWQIFTDAGQYVIRFGNADTSICPVTGVKQLYWILKP